MRATKSERLTELVLTVFQLNGTLIEWGDGFSAPAGLSSARWQMLGAIALAGAPVTAPQIAARMGVTRQGAQKQLNTLMEAQLLQASPNPGHKRSPLYALTDAGKQTYLSVDGRWQRHARKLSATFDAADLETAARVLAALAQAYAADIQDGSHVR